MRIEWRLALSVLVGAAVLPAAGFAAGPRLALPSWMGRVMSQTSPAMAQKMQTPEMRQTSDNPPPGMTKMMEASGMQEAMKNGAPGMEQMMQTPGMQKMMGDGGH